MPLTIDLGVEISTFPRFDEPIEVGAAIYAINQMRTRHGLAPHQWSFPDLAALGVPQPIAEKFETAENLLLRLHELHVSQTWGDV